MLKYSAGSGVGAGLEGRRGRPKWEASGRPRDLGVGGTWGCSVGESGVAERGKGECKPGALISLLFAVLSLGFGRICHLTPEFCC